ncbi:hypothetical protein H5410_031113 [Solanum commersonii]|uniref:Peptidase M50 domain-containing protein n=1 Tax=Solanum commersonii TaxID=4109 RepID=A0A9J5YIZ0_SOLCO|nr:hypothetical protein H5410_031113 [Solanum commersonii]
MNLPAVLPCCYNRLQCSPSIIPPTHFLRFVIRKKRSLVCRLSDNNKEDDSVQDDNNSHQDNDQPLENTSLENNDGPQLNEQTGVEPGLKQDGTNVQVASGSPLPGVKVPQQLDESIRIPKETVEILRNQVFSFDTFFVTSQEPYEGGVLFKGNLRGQAAKTYEKVSKRMQEKLGDDYTLFLLINPEDDKPVAVVVPRMTLQPETTVCLRLQLFQNGLQQGPLDSLHYSLYFFAMYQHYNQTCCTYHIYSITLILPEMVTGFAFASKVKSVFDNLDLLKDGLPGALITAFLLGVHEVSHHLVATEVGIKLGIPYFVPSWQVRCIGPTCKAPKTLLMVIQVIGLSITKPQGCFGAITRILNVVPNREDLLKVAAAGPLAGFSVGFILLLSGFILPPSDGIGIIVDPSVFHESFLAGGIAKLLLGDVLQEGSPISVNPLVIWAWAGLVINAINSIPAGELDGGRIAFAMWGRKASARLSALSIGLLGISSLFNDVAFYWLVLIFFLQRGPISPLSEELTHPQNKYMALGVVVLFLGLLVCLPYPFPFSNQPAL